MLHNVNVEIMHTVKSLTTSFVIYCCKFLKLPQSQRFSKQHFYVSKGKWTIIE